MIYKGTYFQNVDPPSTMKLLNAEPLHDFTKDATVEVKTAIMQFKILYPLLSLFLFSLGYSYKYSRYSVCALR